MTLTLIFAMWNLSGFVGGLRKDAMCPFRTKHVADLCRDCTWVLSLPGGAPETLVMGVFITVYNTSKVRATGGWDTWPWAVGWNLSEKLLFPQP